MDPQQNLGPVPNPASLASTNPLPPAPWSRQIIPCLGLLPYLMYASILGLLIFASRQLWRRPKALGQQLLSSGLAVTAGLLLISSLQAIDHGEAALQLAHFLPYFWLWAALATYLNSQPHAATLLIRWSWALVLGTIPVGFLATAEYWLKRQPGRPLDSLLAYIPPLDWLYTGETWSPRAYAVFNNPNTLATYSVMVIGLIIGLLAVVEAQRTDDQSAPPPLFFRRAPARILLGLSLLANLLSIYCSGSRNGYAGAAVLLTLGVIILRRIPWIRWGGLITLGAVVTSTFTLGISDRTFSWAWFTQDERMNVWQQAIDLTRQSPWWGHGLGSYKLLYDSSTSVYPYMGHAHNLWLSLAAEAGLLSTLALNLVVGLIAYRAVRALLAAPNHALSQIGLGYGLCFLAIVLLSLVDVTYFDARHNILAWLCLAVLSSLPTLLAQKQT